MIFHLFLPPFCVFVQRSLLHGKGFVKTRNEVCTKARGLPKKALVSTPGVRNRRGVGGWLVQEAAGWGQDRWVTQWCWRLAAPLVCAGGRLCKRLQFSWFWAKQAGVLVLFAISFWNMKADLVWSLKFILFLMCCVFFDSYLCVTLVRMHNKASGLIALQALCVTLFPLERNCTAETHSSSGACMKVFQPFLFVSCQAV